MSKFTNHRLIEKKAFLALTKDGEMPDANLFYRDIIGSYISINGVSCLTPDKILLDVANDQDNPEEDEALKRSKILFNYIFQKYAISPCDQKFNENFIKLFFNQLFFGITTISCVDLLIKKETIPRIIYNLDLRLSGHKLYLTNFYSFKDAENENEVILEGKTIFEIEANTIGKEDLAFVAKFGLVDSTIDCNNKYKHILDTRNFLEKVVDCFSAIKKLVKTDPNSIKLNPTIKSKPLFFISRNGETLESAIVNPPKEWLSGLRR